MGESAVWQGRAFSITGNVQFLGIGDGRLAAGKAVPVVALGQKVRVQ